MTDGHIVLGSLTPNIKPESTSTGGPRHGVAALAARPVGRAALPSVIDGRTVVVYMTDVMQTTPVVRLHN